MTKSPSNFGSVSSSDEVSLKLSAALEHHLADHFSSGPEGANALDLMLRGIRKEISLVTEMKSTSVTWVNGVWEMTTVIRSWTQLKGPSA